MGPLLGRGPLELSSPFTPKRRPWSQDMGRILAGMMLSTIIPVPKKPRPTGHNDYRPVALTSLVMKSFEHLVLAHLKSITDSILDPYSLPTEPTGLWTTQLTWPSSSPYSTWTPQDPVFGLQLCLQHHHPRPASGQALPVHQQLHLQSSIRHTRSWRTTPPSLGSFLTGTSLITAGNLTTWWPGAART